MLCNIIATPPCTPLLKHNNNIVILQDAILL